MELERIVRRLNDYLYDNFYFKVEPVEDNKVILVWYGHYTGVVVTEPLTPEALTELVREKQFSLIPNVL